MFEDLSQHLSQSLSQGCRHIQRTALGSIHFQAHLHSFWQDLFSQRLLDCTPQFLAGKSRGCSQSLTRCDSPVCFIRTSKQEKSRKDASKMDVIVFCSLRRANLSLFWVVLNMIKWRGWRLERSDNWKVYQQVPAIICKVKHTGHFR